MASSRSLCLGLGAVFMNWGGGLLTGWKPDFFFLIQEISFKVFKLPFTLAEGRLCVYSELIVKLLAPILD